MHLHNNAQTSYGHNSAHTLKPAVMNVLQQISIRFMYVSVPSSLNIDIPVGS